MSWKSRRVGEGRPIRIGRKIKDVYLEKTGPVEWIVSGDCCSYGKLGSEKFNFVKVLHVPPHKMCSPCVFSFGKSCHCTCDSFPLQCLFLFFYISVFCRTNFNFQKNREQSNSCKLLFCSISQKTGYIMPDTRPWISLLLFLIFEGSFWHDIILGLLIVNILPLLNPARNVIYLYDALYYLAW